MTREIVTVSDAAHEWVREMNAFPTDMIDRLMREAPEEWEEVTEPTIGDRVYVYELLEEWDTDEHEGEIVNLTGPDRIYLVELDDGNSIQIGKEDFEVERDGSLPMWGWMWQFGDSADDWWLENEDGILKMSECGFRIYHHEDWGFFFGIDGCGYSFYDEHWIPLYKARGLKWHNTTTEEKLLEE